MPGQQVGNETFARLQIRQRIAARRIEQASAKAQFAAGGDRRRHLQRRRDIPGHDVDPAKAAEQRHHRAAVFGHRQHRRLGAFLQQQRRQGANDNAGCTQRNDWRVLLIQRAQGRTEFLIHAVGAFDASGKAMDLRRRVDLLNPPRRREAALAEDNDGGGRVRHQPCHRSPGTMISEKYGEDIGST